MNAVRRYIGLVREFLGKLEDKWTRGRSKFNDLYGCDREVQNVDNDVRLAGDPVFVGWTESDLHAQGEDMLSDGTRRKVDEDLTVRLLVYISSRSFVVCFEGCCFILWQKLLI